MYVFKRIKNFTKRLRLEYITDLKILNTSVKKKCGTDSPHAQQLTDKYLGYKQKGERKFTLSSL
jgi:hypothetical protein